jgi:hypothetical protein
LTQPFELLFAIRGHKDGGLGYKSVLDSQKAHGTPLDLIEGVLGGQVLVTNLRLAGMPSMLLM